MAVIGLLGGSFNPPHVAHQLLAMYALETSGIDAVWWMPTYRHVFGKELAPFSDRVAMCELAALALGPRACVSLAEETLANAPGFVGSRTWDLLNYLRGCHPEHQWRLIIGTDILSEAHRWHRWADVVAMAPPFVVARVGADAEVSDANAAKLHVSAIELPAISSTEIRSRLGRGEDVNELLPKSVIGYIADRGLYR